MKNFDGVDEYIIASFNRLVFFPVNKNGKEDKICRWCPFCVSDPSNHKREICFITKQILPFADLVIDQMCPLIFDNGEWSEVK